ncbi:MAG TPA: protein kinase [Pyrinomonadaceae bacterium]|nr:protein kinase [Pyrinomonadaceae bacterium]
MQMESADWQKIEEIFFEAVSLPFDERDSFIKMKTNGNDILYSEVCVLLENDSRQDVFLDEPIFSVGAQILSLDNETILKETEFASYNLIRLLGRGGMGLVLLAEDKNLHRLVALKFLPAEFTGNPENIKRFQNEARAASKVVHQNVAHIYDFKEHEGRFFLVMEYVSGRSVREMIKENAIDANLAFEIISQIVSAVSAAHKNGTMHRDIKPENVLVNDEGLVKVLDFGLAKSIDFDEAETDFGDSVLKTEHGLIMGTTAYMSPEQIRGQKVDRTTDIWSLGVVFYELLTGKRPFGGETRSDTIAAILKTEPEPIDIFKPKFAARLNEVFKKLLDKDRKNRFQNAQDFADALTELKQIAKDDFNSQLDSETSKLGKATRLITSKSSKNYGFLRYAAVFLIVFVLLIGAAKLTGIFPFATQAESINSIAVLPIVIENGSPDQEFLSDGLTDSLINRFSQIPDLEVKARSSVFQFKGKNYVPQKAGKELGVQAVLVGRIVQNNDELTLDLEMVDVNKGNRIWGEKYTYRSSELIPLQNAVVRDVSQKLKQTSNAEANSLAKIPTKNSEAYQLYLKGRFHWSKRTGKDLQKSIEYYDQAVALDPNFALAYAGLSSSYVLLSGYAQSSPHESFPKAKENARKALELDESLAEAHTSLSYALFNYDWNFDESEKEMKRAIELNPNYSTAYHWYGNANLLATGKMDESIAAMEKARELDPLSLIINADLATSFLYAEKYDQAIELYKRTIELDENFYYSRIYLGRTYTLKGDYENAVKELKKAESLYDDPQVQMLLARTYVWMKKPEEARKILNKMTELSKQKYVSPYYLAEIHTGLGEKEEAFVLLEKALEMREGPMIYLKVEPFFRELHNDPRFDSLVQRVGLR